jgi:hypothetical protein
MRGLVIAGALLIVLGLVSLVTGGLTYTKSKETADLGPVDITVKEKKHVEVPTAVGVAAVAGGVVLLLVGTTRKRGST